MGRSSTMAALLALALVACTGSAGETESEASTVTKAPVTDPGRLVVLDEDGDVVVLDADGSNRMSITADAGTEAVYAQPIWSPDSARLSWGEVRETGFAVGIHDVSAGVTDTIPTPNLPFYMAWSPRGDRLGVLHNGSAGIDFNLVEIADGSITRIDTGAPFYFSWSPESDRLVTHVGADRVEVIELDGNRAPLEPTGPMYLAPQWTNRGVYHVVEDELVLETADGDRSTVARVAGLTMFVANSQGSLVALQTAGGGDLEVALSDPPDITSSTLVVVDVETGDVEVVGDGPALGFFWSPGGESLLALVPAEGELVPSVWSKGQEVMSYTGYRPPETMLQDTFPFFPQYAQSVSFWSADSSAFAYAGEIDGERGIWVQEVRGESPVRVSDGRWVAWSGPVS